MSILGNPICMPIGGKAAKGSNLFLAVSLPRSIYYEQAAEWLKIKDDPKAAIAETQWDGQVVCGNSLWLLYGNHAYAYSLEDGELLEDVELTGASGYPSMAIVTDGVSRIWIARISPTFTGSGYVSGISGRGWVAQHANIILYEFDIGTKAVKQLFSYDSGESGRYPTPGWGSNGGGSVTAATTHRIGVIGYSLEDNKIYCGKAYTNFRWQGLYYNSSAGSSQTMTSATIVGSSSGMFEYDLSTNEGTAIAAHPQNNSHMGLYFFDDEDFFYVGNGYTGNDKGMGIYRYNKLSNTWESITTAFEGYTVGPFSYVQLGDKMLQISQTATGIFDPTTGNLDQASVPTVPPDNTVIYPGFKAYANNILYLITAQGVYKCPFFSEVPADAPIVAKIYKGQKYHTLEPFSIPNKVNFTRTQQVATQDIEIKMYEYASEGGQTIYIEDTGEDA